MFKMIAKPANHLPKIVMAMPLIVILAACSSKQIQNAATEPLDLPSEEASMTPEPEGNPTPSATLAAHKRSTLKKGKKLRHAKVAKASTRKKDISKKIAQQKPQQQQTVTAAAGTIEKMPQIGESSLNSAPIAVPPIAPPFEVEQSEATQPNWILAAILIGGLVTAVGVIFRMRRQSAIRKRSLVYNS